jgi:hypothetical protein
MLIEKYFTIILGWCVLKKHDSDDENEDEDEEEENSQEFGFCGKPGIFSNEFIILKVYF